MSATMADLSYKTEAELRAVVHVLELVCEEHAGRDGDNSAAAVAAQRRYYILRHLIGGCPHPTWMHAWREADSRCAC
jgi:hypothetical protein